MKSRNQLLTEVGVAAGVDPKTVARYLRGEPVRDMHREEIERECKKRGLVPQKSKKK
jgi:DNA-binding LacI/PurR family transcriptional regulator